MPSEKGKPVIGFIGLRDQGLPMATAIAEAGYELHVWARRPASLDAQRRPARTSPVATLVERHERFAGHTLSGGEDDLSRRGAPV